MWVVEEKEDSHSESTYLDNMKVRVVTLRLGKVAAEPERTSAKALYERCSKYR